MCYANKTIKNINKLINIFYDKIMTDKEIVTFILIFGKLLRIKKNYLSKIRYISYVFYLLIYKQF